MVVGAYSYFVKMSITLLVNMSTEFCAIFEYKLLYPLTGFLTKRLITHSSYAVWEDI